jgi:hypothetical protein
MRAVTFKCHISVFVLLFSGAAAFAFLGYNSKTVALPQSCTWFLMGAAVVSYGISLIPTRLTLSDEEVWQKLTWSDLRLRWGDITEWQYVEGDEGNNFWIRDRSGKKHQLKGWLVCSKRRVNQVVEIMRQKGIPGTVEGKSR